MTKKTWREFAECKLLWWVNRSLHLFGWAIVLVEDEDHNVVDAFPARVQYRGFEEEAEELGFAGLSKHLAENAWTLVQETEINE